MPTRRAALAVLACLLLAGCSLPSQSREDDAGAVDRSGYEGSGPGLAVQLVDEAPEPFDVTLLVLGPTGDEVARLEKRVEPNETVETWWSLEPGVYSLDMRYRVSAGARTSSGSDEQQVEVGAECPELTRVGWRYLRLDRTVASAWIAPACDAAERAA